MFKEDNQIWLYLIGIIIMFGILIAATNNILVPIFNGSGLLDNQFNQAPEFNINTNLDYVAHVDINYGRITIDLFEKTAPQNVNNFVYLANNGYYTKTKFHRLVPDFLIQGGDRNTLNSDLTDDGKGRPGYLIEDETNWDSLDLPQERRTVLTELGYKNKEGLETPRFERLMVGMANGGPNTNGSQFFILINQANDGRLRELDGRYTPIGKIEAGHNVIDTISKISVDDPNSNSPRPSQDIVIEKIEIFTR